MPTESHFFQCDICRDKFDTLEEAQECEDKGRMEIPPPGIIFGDNRPGDMYAGIIFATTDRNDETDLYHHLMYDGRWAWRDNSSGDNVGKELCGSGFYYGLDKLDCHVNQNMPAFARAVKYLKSRGFTPQVMTENGLVPVE